MLLHRVPLSLLPTPTTHRKCLAFRQENACCLQRSGLLQPRVLQGRATLPLRSAQAEASKKPVEANPVTEAIQQELSIQSNKLPHDVRQRVEAAVTKLRHRVTPGEVAAQTGLKLAEAEEALNALAFDSLAALEVSSEGDVVYSFSKDFQSVIRNKSIYQRAQPIINTAGHVAGYLVRVAFGSTLIISVMFVCLAIFALLSSKDKDDDDRKSSKSSISSASIHLSYIDFSNLLYFWDPYYYRTSQKRMDSGSSMGFLEAVFSFVFGDGDPNAQFEVLRWKLLGTAIMAKGGVVTAEEMAPFLDPPVDKLQSEGSSYKDESYVLPALIKFDGEPFVDEHGHLLYRFPSLQKTGRGKGWQVANTPFEVPAEKPWKLTAASAGQTTGVVALGLFNAVGIIMLSQAFTSPRSRAQLAREGVTWILRLLPWFQAYAATFFVVPALRWIWLQQKNRQIKNRNDARAYAANVLNQGGNKELAEKVASARNYSQRKVLREDEMIFTTARSAAEQTHQQQLDEFDQKLADRSKQRKQRYR